ncbi:MAG: hypothetical protein ABSG93_11290 [Solirubrobacteraceae bacterium]|jgi:hypothetical protein
MTAVQTGDLSAAIEAARQTLERPAMPRVDLGLALRTSTALRQLVPTRLAVRAAEAKGRARWENPDERSLALLTMDAIVGGTARAGELDELARRRLIEEEAQRALFWQPWRTVSLDAVSSENLHGALSCERRLLISACHLGPYFLNMSALTSLGHDTIAVVAPWFFQAPTPDYWGRRIARWRRGIRKRGERLVCSNGSFPVVQALLEQGERVLIYFDMPGSSRTQFLGKPVMLSSGSSQLAFMTEALILPLCARRVGSRVWTDVLEPLDPRGFASPEELHAALAAVHERVILERAETLEDPNRPGAWENGASANAWARPAAAERSATEAGHSAVGAR